MSLVLDGPLPYYTAFPALDPVIRGDFDGDLYVTLGDLAGFVNELVSN